MLLVANKFQTGFDQPLLCGMYVDKRLARHPGRADALAPEPRLPGQGHDLRRRLRERRRRTSWRRSRPYYATAELAATTDPNLVFDLRAKLDAAGHYDDFEVDRVVEVELDPKAQAERPGGGRSSRSWTG